MTNVKVGIIGGTGLGDALGARIKGRPANVPTPFGRPSNTLVEMEWEGTPMAVLNRHGPGHLIHPSVVNYRVCMEGPAFSTRSESEMHRAWGADMIGMTCMPEAKLAREAEIAYALVALSTDYDCWRPAPADLSRQELLREITDNLTEATNSAVELIKTAVARFGEIADLPSPAHSALELAIWSNKELIPPAAKEKLGVLVEKYL